MGLTVSLMSNMMTTNCTFFMASAIKKDYTRRICCVASNKPQDSGTLMFKWTRWKWGLLVIKHKNKVWWKTRICSKTKTRVKHSGWGLMILARFVAWSPGPHFHLDGSFINTMISNTAANLQWNRWRRKILKAALTQGVQGETLQLNLWTAESTEAAVKGLKVV